MADTKISALPAATTPLAGTEVLPVVQSSATTKVSVADLTAGRAVSASSLSLTTPLPVSSGGTGTSTAFTAGSVVFAGASGTYSQSNANFFYDATNNRLGLGTATPSQRLHVNSTGAVAARITRSGGIVANSCLEFFNGTQTWNVGVSGSNFFGINYNNAAIDSALLRVSTAGDVTVSSGNVIPNTAAKGINFTANTPAAGMTSQLLNWYEEGTWTPTIRFSGGSTGVTYSSQAGTYTRIGRQVTLNFDVRLSNKGSSTGVWEIGGFPFTAGSEGHGSLHFQSGGAGINALASIRVLSGTAYGGLYYASAGSTLNYAETDATNSSICIGQVIFFV